MPRPTQTPAAVLQAPLASTGPSPHARGMGRHGGGGGGSGMQLQLAMPERSRDASWGPAPQAARQGPPGM